MPIEVYTVRMGFFDSKAWVPTDLINLYKTELKAMGFFTPQLPSVIKPPKPVSITENDPFEGARSITINLAPFGPLTQTRDTRVPFEQDPAKLAQSGDARATIFTWNLCKEIQPGSAPGADPSGQLRDLFRRTKPDLGAIKLSPKVSTWSAAPEIEPGYPPKPPRPDSAPALAGAGSPWWLAVGGWLVWVAKTQKWF
jgi:hypothetical protein